MEWKSRAHPISDVRDWKEANRLELQPDFQRREVWSKAAQIALIDTIIYNIPIPKIYIKSIIREEKTYRVVIDGQQRLTAILAFVENNLKLRSPHISFEAYAGKKFKDLPEEIRNKILSYNIDFNEIFNPSEEEVRDLYARVNKYTVSLNKQELRRADFPGEFINLASELSESEFFSDNKFFSTGQKRRMLDVEYLEELLALLLEGDQDKKDSLDDFCEKYRVFHDGTTIIKEKFMNVLDDISTIFSPEKPLANTRFRQKADFYSLFGCVLSFIDEGRVFRPEALTDVRDSLYKLDKQIAPHSDDEVYREYAIRCISDANSISTRRWRKKFLLDYVRPLYDVAEEQEEE